WSPEGLHGGVGSGARGWEGEMKVGNWIVAAALFGFALPTNAATTDPLMVLYAWAGAVDSGAAGTNTGVASSVHCTSFSNVNETVRVLVKDQNSINLGDQSLTLSTGKTITFSTRSTAAFGETLLNAGPLLQGSLAVLATSTNIFCTAQVLDASNP